MEIHDFCKGRGQRIFADKNYIINLRGQFGPKNWGSGKGGFLHSLDVTVALEIISCGVFVGSVGVAGGGGGVERTPCYE